MKMIKRINTNMFAESTVFSRSWLRSRHLSWDWFTCFSRSRHISDSLFSFFSGSWSRSMPRSFNRSGGLNRWS